MNNKIQILSSDLINKIAAGEVIERPSSVVKELIENSIDAGATKIEIEIQEFGKKLIRVTDNGAGMTEKEIELALQRHSTSKISSSDDLFNIKTLGFRGEALPSIDSVSHFAIEQNPNGKGLTAIVKDLFYNTPVRLKFLKSKYTEMNHIQTVVSNFILGNPSVSFKLISDGKELLSSIGNGKLLDAIYTVFGLSIAQELLAVYLSHAESFGVNGYVSKPTISRLDRNFEVFFVNGRIVKNFTISKALENAYSNLIPGNRYPIAVLFMTLPLNEVDVNVHPTKREVKFLKTKEVSDKVNLAVQKALSCYPVTTTDHRLQTTGYGLQATDYGLQTLQGDGWRPKIADMLFDVQSGNPEFVVSDIQMLIPLYQHLNTYLICTDGEELVILDQHAAHERILFDNLNKIHEGETVVSQDLLIPETYEFNALDASVFEENLGILKQLGFQIECFGKNTYIIRSIPAVLSNINSKELFTDLISEFKTGEHKTQPEKQRDRLNKIMACRGAIKAGDKLNQEEINRLIKDLYKTENPLTCPHGRPTIVRITKDDLEKMFGRK
ncbi:hypothetical protein A2526_02265 [candidate division WOR-1 bacterium RIFOXYD2_FULL_36_8]|uniref:DNA mismatch repair protein MutL n=1 Tax=candidate division WOR-1 bacterium RIFOXYB2_FULL_36_35 TaxID=1802578 RepID=A0A1F4S2M1_UNCSA|nr:MAG: hypothetical protein A2230_04520 [candidate division WOR-1 bacterium RIFOXYA2_FULL_36_21]OGC14658.1 MAG: hypothetical protein A2290_01250 [candidate division WOR-1 bacterium RIFOXYB2_FULL_36_35]OGC19676.1 MAG: hypothetical protein A2282_02975 [candidate division WOR-1 bacterium RIFOXYA12_FULL_36_13]OGC39142.1 MAG: hypothetical protein A2526_02265 [candidate division WOR-1 bacterium RIFOXYD2_FULL_36_8]